MYLQTELTRAFCFCGVALNMTYENFLKQANLAEQLTSSDFGVSTGLISQGYWENSKGYFVNVERGNIADKLQPRHINVYVYIITNDSKVAIDILIFTFYSDQLVIDVETGMVILIFFKDRGCIESVTLRTKYFYDNIIIFKCFF